MVNFFNGDSAVQILPLKFQHFIYDTIYRCNTRVVTMMFLLTASNEKEITVTIYIRSVSNIKTVMEAVTLTCLTKKHAIALRLLCNYTKI